MEVGISRWKSKLILFFHLLILQMELCIISRFVMWCDVVTELCIISTLAGLIGVHVVTEITGLIEVSCGGCFVVNVGSYYLLRMLGYKMVQGLFLLDFGYPFGSVTTRYRFGSVMVTQFPPRSVIGADMGGTSVSGIGYGIPNIRPVCPECHPYVRFFRKPPPQKAILSSQIYNHAINGAFYLNSCLHLGLSIEVFILNEAFTQTRTSLTGRRIPLIVYPIPCRICYHHHHGCRHHHRHLLLLSHFILDILAAEPLWEFFPSAKSFFTVDKLCKRRIQTLHESSEQADKDEESHKASSLRSDSGSSKPLSNPTDNDQWAGFQLTKTLSNQINNDNSAVKFSATSKLKVSARHDLAMVFTCKVCETRSIKTMCRESYEKGVAVARCGGCNNLHLIADHLGMFGLPGSIEDVLAARGEEVRRGSVDTLKITVEDLAGKEFTKKDG
ncbi:uncharacterized protein LOC131323685 [Rhododendron vialii]|uniref:uncharacterized protein LOC131323685 n=1 Tax=Rhododendron vialii TaxID=182163 RepID=UPI00265E2773|nr:uncharacterized protein LOC131323685 [Rhododendron vialii]